MVQMVHGLSISPYIGLIYGVYPTPMNRVKKMIYFIYYIKLKYILILPIPRSCKRSNTLFQKSLLLYSTWREYFYSQPTHFSSQPKK